MAGSVNYIIPKEDLTQTDRKQKRVNAILAGVDTMRKRALANDADYNAVAAGQKPETIDIREPQLILDIGAALDQWNTAALVAVGTAYSAFQAVGAVAVPANRCFVWYGVAVETVPPPVSRLIFRVNGAAGNVRAVFDLEPLFTQQVMQGLFSEAVIYAPNDPGMALQVLCRIATGLLARVQVLGYLLEAGSPVLS